MRILDLLGRRGREARLDEEIRAHIDLLTEEHVARGLTPDEARAAARRDFGGVAAMREACRDERGWRPLDEIGQDLRYAARTLRAAPGFALIAIATLAIGIGATTAIFSIADATLLNPLPFPQPDRLVSVHEVVPIIVDRPIRVTAPDLVDYEEQTHAFEALGGWQPRTYELSGGRESERVDGERVTASVFRVLQVAPAMGRAFTDDEDRDGAPVCVISDGLWRRWFGADPNVLRRDVHLDRVAYRVIGVMPRGFDFPLRGTTDHEKTADVWVPMSFTPRERQARADNWSYNAVARMKPGVTIAQASADVNAVAQHIVRDVLSPDVRKMLQFSALVRPLAERASGTIRPLVQALAGAVACVLLIACVNVANLLLVRSARRDKEIAMRVALGATRGRILRQLVSETLVLVSLATVAGGALAWWMTTTLARFAPARFALLGEAAFNWRVLLFATLAAGATALLVGLIPGIAAASRLKMEALKQPGGAALGASHRRMRSALVVAETALALVLLVGAGLLVRSFRDLLDTQPGFEPSGAVAGYVSLPETGYPDAARERPFYRALQERLHAQPGIEFAATGTTMPLVSGRRSERVFLASNYTPPAGAALNMASMSVISSEYLQAIGATLVRGRYFTPRDSAGAEPVAIVTEAVARQYWPGKDPLAHRIKWGSADSDTPWASVVGVVGDIKLDSLDEPGAAQIFVPADQVEHTMSTESQTAFAESQLRSMYVVVRGRGPAAGLSAAVRSAVREIDPRLAVADLQPLSTARDTSAAPERFNMLLIGAFAAIALLLAAIGIYGVTAYTVAQRTREIGIRMALGADAGATSRMVLRSGLGLAGLGVAIGIAGAAALAPMLEALLFGVKPIDVPTFASVALLLLVVAALATYLPARRAARVDPMLALRAE
jgi:predicted permease